MAAFPPENVYLLLKNGRVLAVYAGRNAAQAAAYRQLRKAQKVDRILVNQFPLKFN